MGETCSSSREKLYGIYSSVVACPSRVQMGHPSHRWNSEFFPRYVDQQTYRALHDCAGDSDISSAGGKAKTPVAHIGPILTDSRIGTLANICNTGDCDRTKAIMHKFDLRKGSAKSAKQLETVQMAADESVLLV